MAAARCNRELAIESRLADEQSAERRGDEVRRFACEDGEQNHVLELGLRIDTAISELRAVLGEMRRFERAKKELRELKEHGLDAASRDAGLDDRSVAVLQDAAMRALTASSSYLPSKHTRAENSLLRDAAAPECGTVKTKPRPFQPCRFIRLT